MLSYNRGGPIEIDWFCKEIDCGFALNYRIMAPDN